MPGETSAKLAVLRTMFKYDSLVILPTGAGKRLCYAIPAIISGGVTIVVCPLLSLMLDHVQKLRSKGLSVTYINSSITKSERDAIMHNMASDVPPYNFVFVTPETVVLDDVFIINHERKGHFEIHCGGRKSLC
jgi:superfamily II DNA helicase RecQ